MEATETVSTAVGILAEEREPQDSAADRPIKMERSAEIASERSVTRSDRRAAERRGDGSENPVCYPIRPWRSRTQIGRRRERMRGT